MLSKTLRPRDLARAGGVSTDTLRHYERLGILGKPPRTPGNYRSYPPDALPRLMLIRNALAVGFMLRELVDILRERDAGGAPCKRVAVLAAKKSGLIDAQIAQLRRLKYVLKRRVRSWNARLESTPDGVRAFLLEKPRVQTRRSPRKAMQ
jgi:DNA-binding transcriptional MerR regulator